jgi:hypothetical protein
VREYVLENEKDAGGIGGGLFKNASQGFMWTAPSVSA